MKELIRHQGTDVSVVIPTFRRTSLLMECLKALAKQTIGRNRYEVIVVSDGPDAVTGKLVQTWGEARLMNISYVFLDSHKGPAAARNLGWQLAGGRLIAFTDDDCIPEKYWLERLWEAYLDKPYTIFSGRVMVPLSAQPTDHELNTAHLENAAFVTANCACNIAVLKRVGGFDERFRMAWREDSDLEFSFRRHHLPFEYLRDAVVVHPPRKAKWGVSIREQKKTMFNALLFKKYPQEYRRYICQFPPLNYYAMVLFFLTGSVMCLLGHARASVPLFLCWLALVIAFTVKRLRFTRLTLDHILEMAVTSAVIPFLSLYWSWYGSWKFRVIYFR